MATVELSRGRVVNLNMNHRGDEQEDVASTCASTCSEDEVTTSIEDEEEAIRDQEPRRSFSEEEKEYELDDFQMIKTIGKCFSFIMRLNYLIY